MQDKGHPGYRLADTLKGLAWEIGVIGGMIFLGFLICLAVSILLA